MRTTILSVFIILSLSQHSLSQEIDNKIIWIKEKDNLVKIFSEHGISNNNDTLFVLHFGESDEFLNQILEFRNKYRFYFYDYGLDSNGEVKNLELSRYFMKISNVNILASSRNTELPMEYLFRYNEQVKNIFFIGSIEPKTDYVFTEKSYPISGEFLVESAKYGDTDAVAYLLENKISPNHYSTNHDTNALMAATILGFDSVVKILLDYNVDLEYKNQHGATALWYAVNNGDFIITKLLLEKGANPNVINNYGNSALDQAQKHGHSSIIELLKKYK
jgi:hypothetical protein